MGNVSSCRGVVSSTTACQTNLEERWVWSSHAAGSSARCRAHRRDGGSRSGMLAPPHLLVHHELRGGVDAVEQEARAVARVQAAQALLPHDGQQRVHRARVLPGRHRRVAAPGLHAALDDLKRHVHEGRAEVADGAGGEVHERVIRRRQLLLAVALAGLVGAEVDGVGRDGRQQGGGQTAEQGPRALCAGGSVGATDEQREAAARRELRCGAHPARRSS